MLKNHLNKLKNIRKRHESTKATETTIIEQKHLLSELLHKTPCISKSTLQRLLNKRNTNTPNKRRHSNKTPFKTILKDIRLMTQRQTNKKTKAANASKMMLIHTLKKRPPCCNATGRLYLILKELVLVQVNALECSYSQVSVNALKILLDSHSSIHDVLLFHQARFFVELVQTAV